MAQYDCQHSIGSILPSYSVATFLPLTYHFAISWF